MVALLGAVRAGNVWPALPACLHSYTRTRAYGDDRFEVLLLNWSPGGGLGNSRLRRPALLVRGA